MKIFKPSSTDLIEEEIIEMSISSVEQDISIDIGVVKPINLELMETDSDMEIELKDLIVSGNINSGGRGEVYVVALNDTTDIASALEVLGDKTYEEGDILVIKSTENDNASGYIFTTEYSWIAFSGNVSAANALFEEDILCAGNYTQVGNITKTASGTTVIPAKGKTMEEVMTSIFTQELQPNKTEPSVNISFTQAGAYEVGTEITPVYSVSLNPGSYTYGPATAVAASSWSISDTNNNLSIKTYDSFESFVVQDNTNYKITAIAAHTQGTVALTNIGHASNPIVQIAEGNKSKTSSAVTGYRCTFSGVINDIDTLTSEKIRRLTNNGKASSKTITVKVNGNTNAKRICVAIPTASKLKITKVMKTDGLATDITATYTKIGTVQVDGKNNYNLMVSYDIWTYQPAKIDSAEVHEITIG